MQKDLDTWANLKEHYLPGDFQSVFKIIDKHIDQYQDLPQFEDLRYEVRDRKLQEKIFAIESVDVEVDAWLLLDYLKNEYAQVEILDQLDKYIDNTVAMATAEENIEQLQEIVLKVSESVDVKPPAESMEKISLFEDDKELSKYLPLGLNSEYDSEIQFSPKDLVLVGGRRGSGKSVTCCNLAANVYESGRSAIYFTIEMDSRSILQRICSVATRVPLKRLRSKMLSSDEWNQVAGWWAGRFDGGHELLPEFIKSADKANDFEAFHTQLTKLQLHKDRQIDVIYDPALTLSKIQSELDKKVNQLDIGVVIVDYLNQVKRHNAPSRSGQYDWTEQIEVSKKMKLYAQEYETLFFAPYQTDASGEARFAKGILDAADAAYSLETWEQEDNCMTFNCTKMRSNVMKSFSSVIDWETLKIGPQSQINPKDKEDMSNSMKTGEDVDDL
ncbi:DnaB helicase C-terminal domain-containing protein [Gammaproteobacteria bacterium]|nr:DnaB helicase C-terminal domain-containing protein [Gammaproteobacteria bacterium]